MELIAQHENMDFDALAASVAAQKLHPSAVIGLGRTVDKSVREFLALHEERFPTARIDHLELDEVDHLIVVDVRDRRRLRHIARLLARADAGSLRVDVYDHHPASEADLVGEIDVVAPVGAVTTLLVERLHERGIAIDAVEATLFALGIYADTAALTAGGTTSRDALAVAWLLDRGASLAMINRYLEAPFTDAQRRVLAEVLAKVEVTEIAGAPVGIAIVRLERHAEGIDEVTTEALRLLAHGALFTICVVKGKKIEVVGRSRSALLDAGAALRAIGGGGHRGAGSAVVKGGDPSRIADALRSALSAAPVRTRVVADVMSSPVRTVAPELPLDDLDERLDAWGHGGAPVVRDGTLLGVVSHAEIERARESGRGRLPVSSHMRSPPETTTPEAPLEDALAQLVDTGVGRLPVLRGGKIVGIVTRTDLLRALYPGSDRR